MTFFTDETIVFSATNPGPLALSRSVFSPSNGERAQHARLALVSSDGGGVLAYRFGAPPVLAAPNQAYFIFPSLGDTLLISGFENLASVQFLPLNGANFTLYAAYAS